MIVTTQLVSIGLAPRRSGYFGIAMDSGWANLEDCISISLIPEELETNRRNNFEIFEEIDITLVSVDGTFFNNGDAADRLLYFLELVNRVLQRKYQSK